MTPLIDKIKTTVNDVILQRNGNMWVIKESCVYVQ